MTGPASISPRAAEILATADPAYNVLNEGTDWDRTRADDLFGYQANIDLALLTHPVDIDEITVANVRCMRVRPQGKTPTRQILYLFGGGFVLGSPPEELPITTSLANKTNATFIVPYYRLAPQHRFPAALDDIHAVASEMLSQNPNTLLAGESAGGNLALALMHRLRARNEPTPNAIAALSPATDLNQVGDSADADRDPYLRAAMMPMFHDLYLNGQDPTNPEASPIYGDFAGFPPTLLTSGTRDLLLSSCVRLARVMREANVNIDLRIWEGMWHVFEFYPDVPEAEASLSEIAQFLNTHLIRE